MTAITTDQLKSLVDTMNTYGVTKDELLAKFPERPTTTREGLAIAAWIVKRGTVAQDKVPAPVAPTLPSAPQAPKPQNWDDILDGNYAFEYKGKTHFYRVSRREGKGKWAGRTFINVQERASDELYRVPFKAGPGRAAHHPRGRAGGLPGTLRRGTGPVLLLPQEPDR